MDLDLKHFDVQLLFMIKSGSVLIRPHGEKFCLISSPVKSSCQDMNNGPLGINSQGGKVDS